MTRVRFAAALLTTLLLPFVSKHLNLIDAGEQPGKESCRWERPASMRASRSRCPTAAGSSTCEW